MPTVFTHVVAAASAGTILAPKKPPLRFWVLALFCGVAADLDVVLFYFGVPYGHFFGHRGFFHSPFFGLLTGLALTLLFFHDSRDYSGRRFRIFLAFFLIYALHGVLDAMTDGGRGIALLLPFDDARVFLPFRPIRVSPIGWRSFFGPRGLAVIQNEMVRVWLPSLALALGAVSVRLTWERVFRPRNPVMGEPRPTNREAGAGSR